MLSRFSQLQTETLCLPISNARFIFFTKSFSFFFDIKDIFSFEKKISDGSDALRDWRENAFQERIRLFRFFGENDPTMEKQ